MQAEVKKKEGARVGSRASIMVPHDRDDVKEEPLLVSPHSSVCSGMFRLEDEPEPSIIKAREWGILSRPRRIPDKYQPSGYRLARLGENRDEVTGAVAESYNWWTTPYTSLDEFGIGVSLYFRFVLFLCVLFLVCAAILLPSIIHNSLYNPPGTPFLVRGSVVGATVSSLSVWLTGIVDFAVVLVLLPCAIVAKKVEDIVETAVDVSQQTSQDYSIRVKNPPEDLRDPDEYKHFFSRFGEVVMVTVAMDNGSILKALSDKKEIESMLLSSDDGRSYMSTSMRSLASAFAASSSTATLNSTTTPPSDPSSSSTFSQRLAGVPKPSLWKRVLSACGLFDDVSTLADAREKVMARLEAKVAKNRGQRVKRVYVVFNTEEAQRDCLQTMITGWAQRLVHGRVLPSSNKDAMFRDRVLIVDEAEEPTEVVWANLHLRWWRRTLWQTASWSICAGLLVLSYFALQYLTRSGAGMLSAVIISTINASLPFIVREITTTMEMHVNLSDEQESILLKLVVARCLNTAAITYLLTSYDATFSADTMMSIMLILIADAFFNPIIKLLDPATWLCKWLVAPSARTQAQMNSYYMGTAWHLAERYTDVIKTTFVGLFYSAVLPQGLFVTSLSLFTCYWSDKYCLFNIWRRPPALNGTLTGISRNFLTISICVHVVMARIFFANWPYNRGQDRPFCGALCYPTRRMTSDQVQIVHIYNVVLWLTVAIVLNSNAWGPMKSIVALIRRQVPFKGETVDVAYRSVVGIQAYIPIVISTRAGVMYTAADLIDVPPSKVPSCGTGVGDECQNLCSRREMPMVKSTAALKELFGVVKYYPAPAPTSVPGLPASAQKKMKKKARKDTQQPGPPSSVHMARLAGLVNNVTHLTDSTLERVSAAIFPAPKLVSPAPCERQEGSRNLSGYFSNCIDDDGDDENLSVKSSDHHHHHHHREEKEGEEEEHVEGGGEPCDDAETGGRGERVVVAPLPEGWEEAVRPDGTRYYTDLSTMRTQDERPMGSAGTGWTPYRL